VPFTVVGVAPPWFFGPAVGRSFDVIVPLGAYPLLVSEHGIANNWLSIMVRRKAGQTFDQASAALELAQARMRADGSGISGAAPVLSLRSAQTGYSLVPGQYTRLLLTVMAVVAIVLLIACSNLANLLLARASARRRELGARLALGASRGRLVQQLLTESVVVTAIGAAGGLVVAWWGSRLLVRQLSSEASLTTGRIMFGSANLFLDLSVDWRVLLFTMAVTGAAALLFGLAPALQASGVAPMDVLKSDGTTPRGARRTRSGLAGWLIVSQVALSLVLVVAAGLLLRTFSALATVRLGYEPEDVLVVDLLSAGTPVDASTSLQTYDRILNRVRALAGVRHASMSNVPPFNGIGIGVQTADGDPWVAGALVSPGWFDTFGTRLLAGRDFTPNDRAGAPRVAIVNQAFAKAFLPDGFPMGRRISLATANGSPPAVEIVGLAEDIASSSLREPPPPAVFVPLAQVDEGFGADILQIALEEQGLSLSVRSRGESSGSLRASVADAVAAIDPRLTLTFRSPAREVEALLTEERVMAMLSAFFGVLALLLAAVGLYGVTSYAVSRRRAEMGVRVALGANQASIVRLILARSLALTSAGIVVGVIGAAAMTRYLQVLLWGLSPHDPATFIGVPVLFLLVSAIAAVVPAVRAGKVDPLVSLR
jgi:predicted permease